MILQGKLYGSECNEIGKSFFVKKQILPYSTYTVPSLLLLIS